jgi:hypothetical protein
MFVFVLLPERLERVDRLAIDWANRAVLDALSGPFPEPCLLPPNIPGRAVAKLPACEGVDWIGWIE